MRTRRAVSDISVSNRGQVDGPPRPGLAVSAAGPTDVIWDPKRSGSCLAVRRIPEDSNLSDDGVEHEDPTAGRGGRSRAMDIV